jgi:prevent-host-death family protein
VACGRSLVRISKVFDCRGRSNQKTCPNAIFFSLLISYRGANNISRLTSVLIQYYKKTGGDEMNISQDIKPVTYLKSRAADLLKQINETHRPVIITQNGEPKAILQDPKSYENMRNAIGILKLDSQGEEQIRDGNFKSQQEVFDNMENFLQDKMK